MKENNLRILLLTNRQRGQKHGLQTGLWSNVNTAQTSVWRYRFSWSKNQVMTKLMSNSETILMLGNSYRQNRTSLAGKVAMSRSGTESPCRSGSNTAWDSMFFSWTEDKFFPEGQKQRVFQTWWCFRDDTHTHTRRSSTSHPWCR